MNILEKIVKDKELEVEERAKIVPLERIKDSQRLFSVRDFEGQLKKNTIQVIAEIKRRSPSSGEININASPSLIAKSYVDNGAACISVLTDENYFGGQLHFIQEVKSVVGVPILRKDFIISDYQVWESFHAGADAILLMADIVDPLILMDLYDLATDLGLHVLFEVHDRKNFKLFD